jgi:hypothetical protein
MTRLGIFASAVSVLALGVAIGCSSDDDGNEVEEHEASGGRSSSGGAEGVGGEEDTAMGGQGLGGRADDGTGGAYVACATLTALEGEDCGFETNQAETLEVNVLLVMDKSGSMNDTPEGYNQTKWDALHTALSTALGAVRGVVNFGLEFFPATANPNLPIPDPCAGDDSNRCCEMPTDSPPTMTVDIGPGHDTVPDILRQLNDAEAVGGTPTAYALSRAAAYFTDGPGAELGGTRIVLLATDGAPNCNSTLSCSIDTCTLNLEEAQGCPPPSDPTASSCCGSRPEACLDADGTLSAIQDLAGQGIQTVVVGIPGSELYQGQLQDFAAAGNFTKPNGDPGYYEVTAAGGVDELTATFEEITTSLVTECEVPITQEIPNLNLVNVAVDCEVIPKGTDEGDADRWFFDNPDSPSRILINGPICDTIQTDGVERIDTVFGCPTIDIG